jgi:ribosomal-protein-serine acetyltransferase
MGKTPLLCISIDEETKLRIYEERHAQEVAELVDQNRAYLRQWLPWVDYSRTVEDSKAFIKNSLQQFAQNEGFQMGIWYKHELAGGIGYHPIDWADRKVEIGYWLGESFQGKGLMTKACRTLVTYAFDELGLNKVEIHCASGNIRSCAIPKRLGFIQEGTLREAEWLYDHFVDLVVFGMLAREWRG